MNGAKGKTGEREGQPAGRVPITHPRQRPHTRTGSGVGCGADPGRPTCCALFRRAAAETSRDGADGAGEGTARPLDPPRAAPPRGSSALLLPGGTG